MKRALVFVAAALLLCILGLGAVASTRVNVVWYRGRPWVLKFGPTDQLGRCRVAETADPTSDVLSNLIDSDSDGRPDWRTVAFIDASPPHCERRAFLGVWRSMPIDACRAAAEACHP